MDKKKRIPVTNVFPEAGIMNAVGIPTADPQGSYTGRPSDPYEQPVQDADDL